MSRSYVPAATDTICGRLDATGTPRPYTKTPRCGGTLYNVTSRLAEALGVTTLKCDRCGRSYGVRVAPMPAADVRRGPAVGAA